MNRYTSQRNASGFSLVVVLGIGIVSSLFIAGMFSVIMPSYHRIAVVRTQTEMRNAAEAGIDWVVAQYNLDGGASAGIDEPNYGSTSRWIDIPSSVANPLGNNSFTPRVQVQVQNTQPDNTSYVYNPTVAYYQATQAFQAYWPKNGNYTLANPPASNGIACNMWRVITVRAVPPTTSLADIQALDANGQTVTIQAQQASAVVKNLQIVLKPNPPTSFSLSAIATDSSVVFNGGGGDVNAYNSNVTTTPTSFGLGADIDSNGTVDMPNGIVNGDVKSRYTPSTAQETVTGQKNSTAVGRIFSNSYIDSDVKPNTKGQYYDSNGNLQTDTTKHYEYQKNAPMQMPTIPNHPGGSIQINPITGSASLGVSGQTTSYYINNGGTEISLSGQKSITVTAPTRLYLEGNTSNTSTVMSFGGQASINNVSKKPADFVVYYNGTADIDISGLGEFYGVIIAPHATVKVNGNGQIYGAIVGNVFINNGGGKSGGIHYDLALKNANLISSAFTYEPISWREF